jgi:hypothetical protein
MNRVAKGCLAGALALAMCGPALAQDSKSAPLAKQLAAALAAAKLDSIAAKDPSHPDVYIGVLYIPGLQMIAVAAQYSAPIYLDANLEKGNYRDVYIDLNSAGVPASRVFVEDLGADGLRARREGDTPSDSYEASGKRTTFDGDWGRQKVSEQEYLKIFAAADERYAQMLTALLAQLKKTS